MKKKYLGIALLVCSALIISSGFSFLIIEGPPKGELKGVTASSILEVGVSEKVRLTIVYDNSPYDERLQTAWGFACHINADGVSILFDTGGDHCMLLDNMAKLNIDVREIEIIVLSHIHGDHVGGLFGVLELNNQVKVYLPASFPDDFKRRVESYGCEVVEVKDALKICNGVATTGELGATIKEQSLIVSTVKGLVIVAGCAHPGVANIVEKAKELTGMEVHIVLGGFHLSGESENMISSIIERFRELRVVKVAPCHCSGDRAKALFKEEFGEDYMEVGVGTDP
jgi:7,8-dihydropterin-6-yl-methyl-4-(beta-D-ribofuranosyl)aminobenzene 5'-phosphate synthase